MAALIICSSKIIKIAFPSPNFGETNVIHITQNEIRTPPKTALYELKPGSKPRQAPYISTLANYLEEL